MRRISFVARRHLAAVLVTVAGELTVMALPGRPQQPTPTLLLAVPSAATAGSRTTVTCDIMIPRGLKLEGRPSVRVITAKGATLVVKRMLPIEWTATRFRGRQSLNTPFYPEGRYRVRIVAPYSVGNGNARRSHESEAGMTVPNQPGNGSGSLP